MNRESNETAEMALTRSDSNNLESQIHVSTVPKDPENCWRSGAQYCILTLCCLNLGVLFIGGLWPALSGYSLHDQKEIILIHTEKLIHTVSENFLSVALDSSLIKKKWDNIDFRSAALQNMGAALSPCYLRIGGTSADRLIFEEISNDLKLPKSRLPMDGGVCSYEGELCSKHIENFTMGINEYVAVNEFAKHVGMEILFDLNVLLRKDNAWDDSNARKLIKFSESRGYNISWQLGNEPNSFRHVFHEEIQASQLGQDFLTLRRLLNTFPMYKNSLLVGPDVTRPRLPEKEDLEFLREFLREAGSELDAVTWHQYYLNGREASLKDFVDPEKFNVLYEQISLVQKAVRNMALNTAIWLGETGSAYGGGAPHLSDRFVAGFLWLDKLGVAASQGIDVVIRQSLYGGDYGLINENLRPNPDFWLSVLYKSLVGRGVLGTTQLGKNKGHVRVYSHCTAPRALINGLGAVTVFGLNLHSASVELSLQGTHNISSVHRYILEGPSVTSEHVLLNGVRLGLLPDGSVPPLKPQPMDLSSPITLPAFSMGFWVLHGAQAPACQQI